MPQPHYQPPFDCMVRLAPCERDKRRQGDSEAGSSRVLAAGLLESPLNGR